MLNGFYVIYGSFNHYPFDEHHCEMSAGALKDISFFKKGGDNTQHKCIFV